MGGGSGLSYPPFWGRRRRGWGRRRGGGRRRGLGEVYQPGRRETGGERATQRPFGRAPGGDPAANPTPNAQRPKTQRSAVASPTVHLTRCLLCRRDELERGFKTCYRSPRKVTSPPTQRPGVTLPRTQRPTPNPTPNAQTPNAQKMNPYGSRRQREACFRTTYEGPSQSITSGDLVVAALEHPTYPTPNNWSVRNPTPKTQRPSDPTPNAQRQNTNPFGSRPRSSVGVMRPPQTPFVDS